MLKVAEMRQKNIQELNEQLVKLSKEIHETTLDILKRKEKNVKKPRLLRKEVAKIKSILMEKKILSEEAHE
ncbi:hypothetical protein A2415_00505 [candidate division WWE3 bacterium RIFOXYC1_FULL_39_7]|uniref:50S ribosomal protein L29 n=2 Tax=Katanobacteria TaxID=422282 RepID=A0A1F4X473_UNCKA|nr:MAG: hypothetical protein A2415_00505 [candidate division WWE3 bacterium RIFOXYC1_FULL_39_7]OGC76477.1 MAG: hypothetical protein A2619_05960 [candidate division WWE3 bacterium RIFOXYD1_FULL_39_9]